MKIDINYIKQLADTMDEKSIVEISIEDGSQKIAIKKGEVAKSQGIVKQAESSSELQTEVETPSQSEGLPNKKLTPITSPMVGTFYNSATPDAEPFVRIGDTVKQGQVVCIVEAMKLMNEIEADVSGKVVEICVENGQTIEFGQVLMYIE